MIPRPLLAIALPLLAGACAGGTDYPTLAPRPVEKLLGAAPVETPVPAATDAALDAEVAARLADAEEGARAFAKVLAATRTAAARPGATTIGSEPWLAAQQVLTELAAARAPVGSALADLDATRIAAAAQERPVDTTRLDAALARVGALAEEQERAYQDLAAKLPTG